jgi:ribonuclease J
MIEINTLSGYEEVGRNLTAVKIGEEVIILDMGIHLENYIQYMNRRDIKNVTAKELIAIKAIPDIEMLGDWKEKIKAIIPSHAHLDHIGAIPIIAKHLNAPIIATPYTIEVIREILKKDEIKIPNELVVVKESEKIKLTENIEIEFIKVTHSIPHTAMVAIHTKEGIIVYANDFKLDEKPIIGDTTDLKRLKELGSTGEVKAIIMESTYSEHEGRSGTEEYAKEILEENILSQDLAKGALIVSTFSSHIVRLKSIVEIGKRIGRKVLMLGRSLERYTTAGKNIGIIDYMDEVEIVKYGKQIKSKLRNINGEIEKYLIIATGHQGEKEAVLSKMLDEEWINLRKKDLVVFSCKTIPTEMNIKNRSILENKLKNKGVKVLKDLHVSGHAYKEEIKEVIERIKPDNIIPSHGGEKMKNGLKKIAIEMGYKEKNIKMMRDKETIKI